MMMNHLYLLIYIAILSLTSFGLMAADKRRAKRRERRIPEATLHLVELLGGVFGALAGMYFLHHKNRKFSFFGITYMTFLIWIGLLYVIFFKLS